MKLEYALLRELAVKASCDPRTVSKVLRGETVRGMPARRALKVLRRAGLLPEHPSTEQDSTT